MDDALPVTLTPDTAGRYLERRGVLTAADRPAARSLGGGVSNRVVEVTWDDGCVVLKQPLSDLAVEDDWPADVTRVHNEAAAARAYADVIADVGFDDVRVPAVVFESEVDHTIGIECAPDGATMWKRELLDGRVDPAVGRTVGRVLGAVHVGAASDAALRETFADKRPFEQLRVDPYHRTTAARHPDVADRILAETERVLGVERTLVHGDYSPKNVLVHRADGAPTAWVLDFEVAHWGDPAFDTGFMLNHLLIKAVYNRSHRERYLDAARAFWEAYRERVEWTVEAETVAEVAVLMLARVDGKSPVEYVEEGPVADALRTIAKRALVEDAATLDGLVAIVTEEAADR